MKWFPSTLALATSAALVLLFALPLACGPEGEGAEGATPKNPTAPETTASAREGSPNVVLVLADDLDRALFEGSTLGPAWEPEGVSFANALATTSLCCPSRASILRGQYAHNTGLVNNMNEEPGGGARYFKESGLEETTLATILRENGYETWFGGKYLNGHGEAGGREGHVPPGWDNWRAYLDKDVVNENGAVRNIEEHYTDWLSDEATDFLENRPDPSKPFFMQVSARDTHRPFNVPGRHRGAYPDAEAPRPPSFDELDVSDKPSWVREKGPLGEDEISEYDRRHADRLRSTLALEDLGGGLISTLSRTGELDETYVIFTSDNGYHMGIHRIRSAKWTPYTEAHEVPFVIRGPDVAKGESFDHLAANTDIAPTTLDLARIPAPGWMDGRSLVPFLDGNPPDTWRDALLIEGARGTYHHRPAYAGVRRENSVYVEHANGEREYYDLEKDPHQLHNRPEDAPEDLKTELGELRDCSGEGCRTTEGR